MPIYRQITRQVQEAIVEGRMRSGDKLPSHRELAAELVIAPLTVKRAYDELEQLGLIATERGRGTFVTGELPEPDREEGLERVRRLAERLLTEARIHTIEHAAVLRIIEEARKRGGE
jgi:GntR family transcriptional regulator